MLKLKQFYFSKFFGLCFLASEASYRRGPRTEKSEGANLTELRNCLNIEFWQYHEKQENRLFCILSLFSIKNWAYLGPLASLVGEPRKKHQGNYCSDLCLKRSEGGRRPTKRSVFNFFLSYWLNYSWIFEDKSEFQLFVIPNKNLVVYIISLLEVTHRVNFHQKVC